MGTGGQKIAFSLALSALGALHLAHASGWLLLMLPLREVALKRVRDMVLLVVKQWSLSQTAVRLLLLDIILSVIVKHHNVILIILLFLRCLDLVLAINH